MDKQEPSFGSLASGTTGYSDYSEEVIRSISRENESIDDFEHLSHESSPLKEKSSDISQDLVSDITSDSSARDVQGLINTGLGNVVTAVYQVTDNHRSFPAQSETESVVTVDNLHESLLKMDSNRLEMGDGFPNRKEADDKLDKFLQEMGSFAPAKHQEPPENLFKDSFDAKKAATQNFMDNERQVTQPKSTGEEFKDRHLDNKAENKLDHSKTEKEVKLPESAEQLKPSHEETPNDLEGTASEKELIVISPDRSLDSTSSSNEPSNLKLQKVPQSGEKITPAVTPQRTPPHTPKEKVPEPFQQEHIKQPGHFKQQEDFKQPGHHHQPEHSHQSEHFQRQEHVKQPEHFHRQEHVKQPEHFQEPDDYHQPKHLHQSEEHFDQSEEDFHQPEEYFHQPEQPFHQPENFHQAEVHKQPVSSKLPEPSIKHHEQFRHPEPANQPQVFMHPEPVRQTEPVQPVETEKIHETKSKAATIEAEALFCKMGLDPKAEPLETRYAVVEIYKSHQFTTYHVMKSTKKTPKFVPNGVEALFVVKSSWPSDCQIWK